MDANQITDTIASLGNTLGQAVGTLNQTEANKRTAKAANTAAAAQQTNAETLRKIVPLALLGLVVVAVVFVLFRRR